jgi:hypothetical protein
LIWWKDKHEITAGNKNREKLPPPLTHAIPTE